jgi:hypothetical protein
LFYLVLAGISESSIWRISYKKLRDGIGVVISTTHPETDEVLTTTCSKVYIGVRCLVGIRTMEDLRVGVPENTGVRSVIFYEFEPVEM